MDDQPHSLHDRCSRRCCSCTASFITGSQKMAEHGESLLTAVRAFLHETTTTSTPFLQRRDCAPLRDDVPCLRDDGPSRNDALFLRKDGPSVSLSSVSKGNHCSHHHQANLLPAVVQRAWQVARENTLDRVPPPSPGPIQVVRFRRTAGNDASLVCIFCFGNVWRGSVRFDLELSGGQLDSAVVLWYIIGAALPKHVSQSLVQRIVVANASI